VRIELLDHCGASVGPLTLGDAFALACGPQAG
jgi:hypothetical protein